MTAVLPFAAMALQAGGAIYQGISGNNAEKAQARIDEENARLSLLSGEQDAYTHILQVSR